MSKFWTKVEKCKHENISGTYYETGTCETPYCSWSEEHCLDCGVYISTCGCSFNQGLSGWPHKRHMIDYRKKT